MTVLSSRFFDRPAEQVARALLGQRLRSTFGGTICEGWIAETEAYLGVGDPASHAFAGRRYPGNRSIYGAPGTWYVYRSYGIHWCINLVVGPAGAGAAVLIRAIVPEIGVDLMRRRRGGAPDRRLADGPGKLSQALGIPGTLDGIPMAASPVTVLAEPPIPDHLVSVTPRIGITKAAEEPLRFIVEAAAGGRR